MSDPKLDSGRAEQIVNLLRDNPGVSQTLSDIADATQLPIEEVAAYLEDLADHGLIIHELTPDSVDVYRFPEVYQRGAS